MEGNRLARSQSSHSGLKIPVRCEVFQPNGRWRVLREETLAYEGDVYPGNRARHSSCFWH